MRSLSLKTAHKFRVRRCAISTLTKLDLHYYSKENSGPGQSRNYGAERAKGEYLLILDSDVVLPKGYIRAVSEELKREPADAFGGPDCAHESFTDTQKAISYSMTSFFTTGGIRGGKRNLTSSILVHSIWVSAVMSIRSWRFLKMRFGEDIDFSIRIFKAGKRCRLFPEAWVWHKRRTDFRKFWKQVYNSGTPRINLYKKYPESLKLVHLLPMVFTVGTALLVLMFSLDSSCSYFPIINVFGSLLIMMGLMPLVLYSVISV